MDKKRQIIIKILLITIFVLLFIGTLVRFNIISFENNNLPEAIVLNKVEFGIKKNDTYNLVATIYPINSFQGRIKWESSDTNIIEVDNNGIITGKGIGDATITASIPYNKISVSCNIHVIDEDIPMDSFALTTSEINLAIGMIYDINYQVYPSNSNSKYIYYASSDENVATVDNLGHITGKGVGTAYIKAYILNGNSETIKVNVLSKLDSKKINLSSNSINLNVGSKMKIKSDNNDVYWESLNPNIVRINNGMIEALNVGDTKIIAKVSPNLLEVVDVQVTPHKVNVDKIQIKEKAVELYINDKYEITVGILPLNATNKDIMYSSSNPLVATIENGVIKAMASGRATIIVRDRNSNVHDTVDVTVYKKRDNVELEDLEFVDDEIVMFAGSSMNLEYDVTPSNATYALSWSSSDNDVVMVDDGLVRAIEEGMATIYVNYKDISKKIDIRVIPVPLLSITTSNSSVYLSPNETYSLNLGFVPNNASNIDLEYISDNPNVAIAYDGIIEGVDVGNTTIKVKSNDIELDINVEVR